MHSPPTFIHIHSGPSTFQYILVALHIAAHSAPPIFHYIRKLTFLALQGKTVSQFRALPAAGRTELLEALKKNKDLKAAIVNPVAEIFQVPDSVKKKEEKIDYIFKLPCFNKE